MNFVRYALWLFLALLAGQLTAAELSGKVVGISDGDTLTLLVPDGSSFKQVKVRLAEIDTPESKQPYGERAKQALSDLAFGKPCPDCACSGLWGQQFVQIQPQKKPPWSVSRAAFVITSGGHRLPSLYRRIRLARRSSEGKRNSR